MIIPAVDTSPQHQTDETATELDELDDQMIDETTEPMSYFTDARTADSTSSASSSFVDYQGNTPVQVQDDCCPIDNSLQLAPEQLPLNYNTGSYAPRQLHEIGLLQHNPPYLQYLGQQVNGYAPGSGGLSEMFMSDVAFDRSQHVPQGGCCKFEIFLRRVRETRDRGVQIFVDGSQRFALSPDGATVWVSFNEAIQYCQYCACGSCLSVGDFLERFMRIINHTDMPCCA